MSDPSICPCDGFQHPRVLSNLPGRISRIKAVRLWKSRWPVEQGYQQMKEELGLNHFEGRSWRGFHHHATLCIAAYGFLVSERGRFPPSASALARRQTPVLPANYRPRGAPDPARASRA